MFALCILGIFSKIMLLKQYVIIRKTNLIKNLIKIPNNDVSILDNKDWHFLSMQLNTLLR